MNHPKKMFMMSMNIQRFLIIHMNFYELCGEKSNYEEEIISNDELITPIFYFYSAISSVSDHHNNNSNNNNNNNSNNTATVVSKYDYNKEEAIQFAGLCKTLYGLPQSLQIDNDREEEDDDEGEEDDDSDNDEEDDDNHDNDDDNDTRSSSSNNDSGSDQTNDDNKNFPGTQSVPSPTVIQLTNCILIFQPIEPSLSQDLTKKTPPLIVACIQLAKPGIIPLPGIIPSTTTTTATLLYRQQQQQQQLGITTPSAFASAVYECHQSFCSIYGGGIHQRMCQTTTTTPNDSTNATMMKKHVPTPYHFIMNQIITIRKRQREIQKLISILEYENNRTDSIMTTGSNEQQNDHEHGSNQIIELQIEYENNKQLLQEIMYNDDNDDETTTTTTRNVLPLWSIQRDLQLHYDTFIKNHSFS